MKVVALYRVSTERQADEGASLDAQQRAYRALADRNGWETVGEFRGTESATQASTERQVLQRVLACVREQSVDAIYVHEQSRLTRGDQLEVAMLFRELQERKLKIIVNGVVRDLSSLDERFMLNIQSVFDRAESERIKERMGRGKKEKARQGKRSSGAAPFGYENPPPGAVGRGTLKVVPDEAAVVRRLFALSASGKGDRAVAMALNELGLPAARGGAWCKTAVRRVLENVAYLGTAASGIWRAVPGTRVFKRDLKAEGAIFFENAHDPIVDRATWDAVHGRAKLARTPTPRMLSGMLFVNGEHFHGDSSRGNAYYRAARGKAGSPWLHVDGTDAAVWGAFASLATSPEFVQRLMAEASNPKEQAVIGMEIEHIEGQIARQHKRLDHLVEMRSDGEIDKATFVAKSDEARKAVERLSAELSDLRSRAVVLDGTVADRIVRAVQLLLPACGKLSSDQKRSILRSIVRRVDVTAGETGARQARAGGGRLAGSGGPRWAVKAVAFRLALPPQEPATGERGADEGDAAAVGASNGDGHRDGQLPTTFSCSAPPAPANR